MKTDNIQIVRQLLKKTKEGEIKWTPTSIRNQYSASVGIGTIIVDYADEVDNMLELLPTFKIDFQNSRGETVESVEADNEHDINYPLFDNLWKEIIESYYQTKQTMSSIRAALGMTD